MLDSVASLWLNQISPPAREGLLTIENSVWDNIELIFDHQVLNLLSAILDW